MGYFMKLNGVSAIFALLPFIISELLVNVYRISRISGIELSTVDRVISLINISSVFASVVIFIFLIKKYLPAKKANFLSSLLWIPFYFLYIRIFIALFPMNNPADNANTVTGLIIIAGLFLYPFLLVGVIFFARRGKEKNLKSRCELRVR